MRIFHDWEFLETGEIIFPISVGMVSEDGREFYKVNADVNFVLAKHLIRRHPWVMANVVPHLPLVEGSYWPYDDDGSGDFMVDSRHPDVIPSRLFGVYRNGPTIGQAILEWLRQFPTVELWGWYAAYDHVCLMQQYGPMAARPDQLPMVTFDLQQEYERLGRPGLPEQDGQCHRAIDDARYMRRIWQAMRDHENETIADRNRDSLSWLW